MNPHGRRKAESLRRSVTEGSKLRCAGCDRVGRPMTKEHFFASWLIEHADVQRDGIEWIGRKDLSPDKATVPLYDNCNNAFGGEAINDVEAELIVRWMWKFEGLQWALYTGSGGTTKYSLRDRIAEPHAFAEIRPMLLLAMATCHANDPGFDDWPLGIDTPPGEDAITMCGAFKRGAIVVSLTDFEGDVPNVYGKYVFGSVPSDRSKKVFSPPCSFLTANGAIDATKRVAVGLRASHGALQQQILALGTSSPGIIPVRNRIELPPVEDQRTPRQPLPLPCAESRVGEPILAQREAMSMILAATAPRRPRIATMGLRPWGGYAETGRSPGYSNSYHETASYAEESTGEVVICGSRLWQQGRWEDISAGEWQRQDMMWHLLRAGPIAMLFAGMASRLRARSATFTSRMSTSLTIRNRSGRSRWCYSL